MSSRQRGGIIGVTLSPTTTAASGVWTLCEAESLRRANTWPRGPAAPTGLSATAGNAQISLSWTAPATTHGTITNYLVEYTPSGGSAAYVLTNSTSTSYTLAGLTNGTAYTVRVAAVNFTAGDYSGTATGTPTAFTPPTLHTPYGAVSGSGTAASPWYWQSGGGFGEGNSAKLLTANSTVTLAGSLVETGNGNCDGGWGVGLQVYSAANAYLRNFVMAGDTLTSGQYVRLGLDCAHAAARIWIV